MASFLEYQKAKINAEKEMVKLLKSSENAIREYVGEMDCDDFSFTGLRDMCLDCDSEHELLHFPVMTFAYFFEDEEFYVQIVIYKNNIAKLMVNDGESDARVLTSERNLCLNQWNHVFWGDEKIETNVKSFVEEITPLIFVYLKVLN